MKKIITFSITTAGTLIPSLLFAAGPTAASGSGCGAKGFGTLANILNWASCILIDSVLPLLVSLAVVGFVYGIITYFLNPDNEEKRKGGKQFMIWGLIGLFAIISLWGLVGVLSNTFGVKTLIPQLSQ